MTRKMILGLASAAIALAALAGTAVAQTMATWTEPTEARFTIQRPGAWPVDPMRDSGVAVRHYAAGLAAADCNIYAIRRDSTAARTAASVRTSSMTPLTAEQWVQVAATGRYTAPTVTASSVDTSQFFPIQRATLTSGSDTIIAGLHARPGLDVWVFCQSYDSRDRTTQFESIIRSVATPQDATFRAQIEGAAPAAPPALAPAPTPAPQ